MVRRGLGPAGGGGGAGVAASIGAAADRPGVLGGKTWSGMSGEDSTLLEEPPAVLRLALGVRGSDGLSNKSSSSESDSVGGGVALT